MLNAFRAIFYTLLDETRFERTRYLYSQISLANRLMGIVGPRGVGKTTTMLQFIKKNLQDRLNEVLYFSADHLYFTNHSLVEFVHDLYFNHGIKYFFIDEIHKYPNWNQELKNIYDSYPQAKVIFSGSSSIDLVRGAYDLSRRVVLKHLYGFSFREYLNFKTGSNHEPVSPESLIENYRDLDRRFSSIEQVRRYFEEYLQIGYYPFILSDEEGYFERINQIVDKTIYEDIANFYKIKTENIHYLKKILAYLTTIPPGEVNTNNLAKNLSFDNKTAFHYLDILNDVGLIHLIYPEAKGNLMLRKIEKVFLNNTTLHYALNEQLASPIEKGTIRELFFIQHLINAQEDIFYTKQGDYIVLNQHIEIGGKNKGRGQVRDVSGILVKDGVLMSSPSMIPLYFWGFCY